MADIKVKDLVVHNIAGVDLFSDSESFMLDLSDGELNIKGGNWLHDFWDASSWLIPTIGA
jgi:hypothetical protein